MSESVSELVSEILILTETMVLPEVLSADLWSELEVITLTVLISSIGLESLVFN